MICQQIGKLRRNGQVSRNTEPAKIDKKKDNLNRPITRSEIQSVVKKKKFPANRSTGPEGFTVEFYQTYTEEPILIVLKLI